MKTYIVRLAFLYAFAAGFAFTSCSEWMEAESLDFDAKNTDIETTRDDAYYAALREWKNTPELPQTFVWFDGWNGSSPDGAASMRGLPDSVTLISLWNAPKFILTDAQRADMEYVRRVKGTKVVVCILAGRLGDRITEYDENWWDDVPDIGNSSDAAYVRPYIAKYAESIHDAVVANGFDGFDWDYEPTVGGDAGAYLWRNKTQRTIFVEELSYWFGKGATEEGRDRGDRKPAHPGLLLVIDGEVGSSYAANMDPEWPFYYFDYFVHQAYNSTTVSALNTRVNGTVNALQHWVDAGKMTKEDIVKRCILTENFESHASSGGGILTQSSYIYVGTGSHAGVDQQIGGFGVFRVGLSYLTGSAYGGSPEYSYLRQGITNIYRIYNERMNPPAEEEPEP